MKQTHKVRATLIFILFFTLYAALIANLFIIQILQNKFFKQKADQQYLITITCLPPRAEIYDRHGNALALNKDSLAAFIVPNQLKEPEKLQNFLRKQFPTALQRLEKNKRLPFMYIKRRLTPEQKALIDVHNLSDIQYLKEPSRFYPIPSTGALVGITDIDNNGLFGLELLYNAQLAGYPSTYILEKDARSGHFYFTKQTHVQGAAGVPVTVTLDSTLQFLVYEELKETVEQFHAAESSALIMDPTNGDILAMVSYPDFDANNTLQVDLEKTKNKLITQVYELGSVMKTFLALAALEEQLMHPEDTIDCENRKTSYVNGMRVNTWKEHGVLNFSEVIELSNNIGTAKIAQKVGTKLYDHYKRCGFGKKTGIKFLGEQAGFVNPPARWSKQSLNSLSYGYEINATLLQLACAFCMIANHGYTIKPRLLLSEPIITGTTPLYSAETMHHIRAILEKTVTNGTAHKAAIDGYTVMGKTGTANLLVNGVYNPHKNIYTFAMILEKGTYKRVIITFVKESARHDIYASSVTVPLAEHIAHKMLIHEKNF